MIDPIIILVLNVSVLHSCDNVPIGTTCAGTYEEPDWYTGYPTKWSKNYLLVVRKIHQNEPDILQFFMIYNNTIPEVNYYEYTTYCEGDCLNMKSEYKNAPFIQSNYATYNLIIAQQKWVQGICNQRQGCHEYGEWT